ncbi:hypothetical protein D3Z45_07350 [Lachnospiraceae bacterium]|nr:hypothetical protein [Lachnospiraceae bacterium]
MKRLTAYLMAFCLFAVSVIPAHAAQTGAITGGNQASDFVDPESKSQPIPPDGTPTASGSGIGEIDGAVQAPSNEPDGSGATNGTVPPSSNGTDGNTTQIPSDGTNGGTVQTPPDGVNGGAVQAPSDGVNGGAVQAPSDGVNGGASQAPSNDANGGVSQTPSDGANGGTVQPPNGDGTGTGQDTMNPNPEDEQLPDDLPDAINQVGENVENNTLQGTAWNDKAAASGMAGGIEVILRNTLPIDKMAITVTIEKDNIVIGSQVVSLENHPEKHSVYFPVEPGTYSLKAAAPGFLTFAQDISVQGDVKSAEIHTGFINLDNISYSSGTVHPGVMLIGDANGDGVIDDKDKNAIIDAISGEWNGSYVTDLNGDGLTNLVDLQHYADSRAKLNGGVDTSASVASSVSPSMIQININDATTKADGSMAELLMGKGGSVILSRSQGEAISESAPVEIGFNLQSQGANGTVVEQIEISTGADSIQSGWIIVETDTGVKTAQIIGGTVGELQSGEPEEILSGLSMAVPLAARPENGEGLLVVNLGKQIAVKKVSLRITGSGKGTLAEITKVEFLNDMEKRIPEPEPNIPRNLSVTGGDKSFSLSWEPQVNITGYEVEISYHGQTETVRAASNSLEVKSFQNDKLVNEESYEARVRSVNGTWTSPYSDKILAVPKVTSRPDPPDNLKAVGGRGCIRMSWKAMKDTDTYNVYYKESGEGAFQAITGIEKNQYEIKGLKDETTYEVYVTGVNVLGESNPSLHSEATTITLKPAQMPNYKLLNESNGTGVVSAHIASVAHGRGQMESSLLDKDSQSALGTVDKDFSSYYQVMDWDDGAEYVGANKGLLFTFDDYYKMSYIAFAEPEDIASYGKVSVFYYDTEHPNGTFAQNVSVSQRTDSNGRKYYFVKLAQPITTNKIRLGFARGYGLRNIAIAEVNFYHYDSLEDDILALYGDDLHTTLKEGVTVETIDALQARLDTVDAKSGEYHPERAALQRELDNAKGLLTTGLRDIVYIHTEISAGKDGHLGFSGLNGWQPLGVTAYEGEQIVVYVGHDKLKTGSNSALKLIATQYHAEAGSFASEVATLKVGRNEITIPSIQSLAFEGGGALYVQYTGNNENEKYAVRVSGGAKEPVLDLYGVSDPQERKNLITAYVTELEEHAANQEILHAQVHETAGDGFNVNRVYDNKNCILGATDIVLDKMMLSVSAEKILAGLGSGSTEARADQLEKSLSAMEEMMDFFYHHKGLSEDPSAPQTDRMPAQHLNIRYMRMFAGAFMYASGNHIGIEWDSVSGLSSCGSLTADADGRYISGNYFGWGIAHEIGHNINQGSYAIAEVTNNYFAQLAQAKDSDDSVRFTYENVYDKVTSNTVGKPSNVFTHLAMYWQLHLAYDRGYNFKVYNSYQEQHDNLFFARVDTYSRNTSLAPGNLSLNGGSDQNFMRLACAAAEKDLTEFFIRWGLVPDGDTTSYAGQFPKEERALYYLTDNARVYEIEHGVSGSVKDSNVIGQGSTVSVSDKVTNEVTVSIQNTANPDVILGYEIIRYFYQDGQPIRQVVGFSTEPTYRDYVSTINNRVLTYEVIAVDKFGYRSNAARIGDVRISHDGSYDKSSWVVTTNMASAEDEANKDMTATEDEPCSPNPEPAVSKIIDNDYSNVYSGYTASSDAVITLQLGQVLAVCGLTYTVQSSTPIGNYEILISVDGSNWTTVKTGTFDGKKDRQTVYFENAAKDPWICTYDAAYVRLKATGQNKADISEIDLLGPAGDSISCGVEGNGQDPVGILAEDYAYTAEKEGGIIPAGSLIFLGNYKGNPAYNVVMIYDEEGNPVGGVDSDNVLKAEQIILANVPENGLLGEVSDGIWIYWIEPENGQLPDLTGKTVRAQLYRVDNALTNEGQRLVSDAMPLQIPDKLNKITFIKDTGEKGDKK